jgi:hypothetical protein
MCVIYIGARGYTGRGELPATATAGRPLLGREEQLLAGLSLRAMATRWYSVGVLTVSTSPRFPRAEPAVGMRAARPSEGMLERHDSVTMLGCVDAGVAEQVGELFRAGAAVVAATANAEGRLSITRGWGPTISGDGYVVVCLTARTGVGDAVQPRGERPGRRDRRPPRDVQLGSPESALVDRERVGVSPVEKEAKAPRASACSPDEVHHRLLTKR